MSLMMGKLVAKCMQVNYSIHGAFVHCIAPVTLTFQYIRQRMGLSQHMNMVRHDRKPRGKLSK